MLISVKIDVAFPDSQPKSCPKKYTRQKSPAFLSFFHQDNSDILNLLLIADALQSHFIIVTDLILQGQYEIISFNLS